MLYSEIYDYKDAHVFKKINKLSRFAISNRIIMQKMWGAYARKHPTRMLASILATYMDSSRYVN